MAAQQFWSDAWYQGRWWLHLLRPLAWLFSRLATARRRRLQMTAAPVSVPVVVVGNISLGGTGKTPLLITLIAAMRERGFRPGVVSRGYGGTPPAYPYIVTAESDPVHSGDEPLLIAMATGCPVVISPRRDEAISTLLQQFDCDLVFSDDGLQHYRMARDIELCVVDGQRGLGNGFCLPAGPLRESPQRLAEVDWIIINGDLQHPSTIVDDQRRVAMSVVADTWSNVKTGRQLGLAEQVFERPLLAVSGIGNPQRFFDSLTSLGLQFKTRVFTDHHAYQMQDFSDTDEMTILMTSKDAVKCRSFARTDWWSLAVVAHLPDDFFDRLAAQIGQVAINKKATTPNKKTVTPQN